MITLSQVGAYVPIHWYGFFIALGVLIFWYLVHRDDRRAALMSAEQLSSLLSIGIVSGIVGGRALFVLTNAHTIDHYEEILFIWRGGFSILGSIIAIVLSAILCLRAYNIPILAAGDLIASYAPLLQGIARVGCFFAGCCYGTTTACPWGYATVQQDGSCVAVHPTQLYSALVLLLLFFLLYGVRRVWRLEQGTIFALYLFGAAGERCIVDFFRADRILTTPFLSVHQWISCMLMSIAAVVFIIVTKRALHESVRHR